MREFPKATPRPWRIKTDGPAGNCIEAKVAQWPDGTDRYAIYAIFANFQGAGTSATTYTEERAACEDNGNLIVRAVNTYEQRERLLILAAVHIGNLLQVAARNEDGHVIKSARAFLADLEARDA